MRAETGTIQVKVKGKRMRINWSVMPLLFCALAQCAQAAGVLGTPVDGSTVSGVSVISGYHCASTDIEIRIDGTSIGKAGAGTTLPSTAAVCGHAETGYSLLYNWNNLSPGQHTVSAYADGELIATNTISTLQSGGAAWLTGASQTMTVSNFPQSGKTATVEWVQSIQNFMVTEVAGSTMKLALLAGSTGGDGKANGVGADARFYNPLGVADDSAGNVYVADTGNYTIRKITPSGTVSTLAGKAGTYGDADGPGVDARFVLPEGIAVDASGNVLVADTGNHALHKVTPAGLISTLAGVAGSYGSADGVGAAARFYMPNGIAAGPHGDLYVADTWNHTVRRLTQDGTVTTLAGLAHTTGSDDGQAGAASFRHPFGVVTGAMAPSMSPTPTTIPCAG